ncbi:MAG: PAS domain S-box protein [Actinomycetota bacterium]
MRRTQNLELGTIDEVSDRIDGRDLPWLLDLVQNLDVIVWEADPATLRFTFVSERAEDILGYPVDQWLSEADFWVNLLHPEDRERTVSICRAATERGEDHTFEYRAIRADGSIVWLRDIVRVSRDAAGRPRRLRGVMVDITEAKRTQEQRRRSEEMLQALLGAAPDAVVMVKTDGLIALVNTATQELFGYTADELIGAPLEILVPDRAREGHAAHREGYFSHPRTRAMSAGLEIHGRRKDGTEFPADIALGYVEHEGEMLTVGSIRDTTEQNRRQEALLRAEERYRSIFENSVEGIFQTTCDGGYLAANPALARMLGYASPEELMARVTDVSTLYVEPGGREEFARDMGEHGAISEYDYQVYRKDGSTIWVSEKVRALRDPDGGVVGFEGTTLDITERRRTEQELRDSEARYRRLFENNPHPMWVFEVETLAFVAVNDAAVESYGYSRDEFLSMTIKDIRPAEDVPTLLDHVSNTQTNDREEILRHRKKDGTVIDVEIASHAVTFAGKQARLVMANDVTKRVLAERQLREAEARYRALVEQMPAVTYIDHVDLAPPESMYMSPQVEAMLGHTSEEFIADPALWERLLHPHDRDRVLAEDASHYATGDPLDHEYRIIARDGRVVWVRDLATVVRDEDGRPTISQGVVFDVTEQKVGEQALRDDQRRERQSAKRLRVLDDMKNTFLAAVSHELRTPLTSILGISLTLERQDVLPVEDRVYMLRSLVVNARKLDRLLKDLLDVDRLSRGIVEPNRRNTDVGALARRTVESLDTPADRPITVLTEPTVAEVDPAKIERIIENLLANAARYTGIENEIWLRVQPRDGGVLIVVEDDGPGVPADLREVIFEPFRQGPAASKSSPGTGIGLSLVARFAELHGGRAWVEERDGGGASFHVFLPSGLAADGAQAEPATERRAT